MGSSSYSNSPCAACKLLRRKCLPDCIFAPYFPPEDPHKFLNVHKVFGASNVSKILNDVEPHMREDTVNSLAYEAEERMKDPVYGCVGLISTLQRQVLRLQDELDAARANLIKLACIDQLPASYNQSRLIYNGGNSYGHQNAAGIPNYQYCTSWSNISSRINGSPYGHDHNV